MRKRWRVLLVLVGTTFRVSPGLATSVFALTAFSYASIPLQALGGKLLIDAAARGDVRAVVLWAVGTAVVAAAGYVGAGVGIGTLRMNMEERTRLHIERHIIELTGGTPGVEHHERPEYADEIEILRRGQGQLAQPAGPIVFLFGSFISAAGAFVLLARLNPWLLLLPLLGIPSLVANAYAARERRRAWERTAEDQRMTAVLFELATSPAPAKEVRIFGLGTELHRRVGHVQERILKEWTHAGIVSVVTTSAAWTLFSIGYVGAVALVVIDVIQGRGTPGDVLLVLMLAGQINELVSTAATMTSWLGTLMGIVRRYVWLMDYARDAQVVPDDLAEPPDRLDVGIELEGVTFTYPGADDRALSEASLRIPAGTTLAIVGDNGAGKSTLVKLLCRFYEPSAGRILVDGVDLRRFEHDAWRARCSAGFQDFAQFHFLARESVGVGDLSRTEPDAVLGALDRAHGLDVLDSLPDGLETQLGKEFDDGVELSVGEWQKVALGRAMMREAPLLLVLDEPTASLDAQTEHALFERYASGASRVAREAGAITVLVSHRFSTVRMADLIAVVDDGRITESGSHEELMAMDGTYAELYRIQSAAYRT